MNNIKVLHGASNLNKILQTGAILCRYELQDIFNEKNTEYENLVGKFIESWYETFSINSGLSLRVNSRQKESLETGNINRDDLADIVDSNNEKFGINEEDSQNYFSLKGALHVYTYPFSGPNLNGALQYSKGKGSGVVIESILPNDCKRMDWGHVILPYKKIPIEYFSKIHTDEEHYESTKRLINNHQLKIDVSLIN